MIILLIIAWLIVGVIVGAIARFLVPGPDPMGCLGTALLGIGGSLIGGVLAALIFHRPGSIWVFHPAGIIGSVIGAIILLLLRRALGANRR